MWCYIHNNDIDKFIQQYPDLQDIFQSIVLLQTKDMCFLPRYMYVKYPSNLLTVYQGKTNNQEFDSIDLQFTGQLRQNQLPIVKHALNLYQANGHLCGIIKARPGLGKTVIATYLTCKLGLKTLIVVDNSNLLKQWVNAFYNFTNIDTEMSIFKQKLYQTTTPVTIGMIQTLTRRLKNDLKKTYELVNNNNFGLVIYDEVHNTSAASEFAKGSLLFRTKNILGLSATPFQTGVGEILMMNTIGDIIYETTDYELTPEFKFIHYESDLPAKNKAVINKTQDYIMRKSMYNKFIVKSEKYLDVIESYTHQLYNQGHKILILCFTKKQVENISDRLNAKGLYNTMFYGEQKEIQYNETILVTTYAFAGKGFDYADLSAMILACPLAGKKSIIQTVGRILRIADNKIPPVVIDLIDMSLQHMMLPELKMKKQIIKNEFKCKISEEYFGDD